VPVEELSGKDSPGHRGCRRGSETAGGSPGRWGSPGRNPRNPGAASAGGSARAAGGGAVVGGADCWEGDTGCWPRMGHVPEAAHIGVHEF